MVTIAISVYTIKIGMTTSDSTVLLLHDFDPINRVFCVISFVVTMSQTQLPKQEGNGISRCHL